MTTFTAPHAVSAPRLAPPAIELSGVSKRFGTVTALSDLSLSVPQGQLLALLGPNGAGKTTAITLMLGLRPPSGGQVRLMGGDPREARTRAQVGAMLQESDLPGLLTVRELVTLFGRFYPHPLTTERALDLADLREAAGKRAATLSGGQRRRLIFALAVVGDPAVLFLDEPTTAMDPQSRAAFWRAIDGMKAQGRTIVLTTHHMDEAERVADRIVVINHGRLIADGTPDSIRSRVQVARVRFTSELVLAELRALRGVEGAEVDDAGRATLTTRTPEALLAELFARGVTLQHLEVTRASLEEAFLSLTEGKN